MGSAAFRPRKSLKVTGKHFSTQTLTWQPLHTAYPPPALSSYCLIGSNEFPLLTPQSSMKANKFFLLVFALSVPFWILGATAGELTKSLPIKLPISALMAVCPALAALLLVAKESKLRGAQELLKQVFDGRKVSDKRWFLLIVFLMPVVMLVAHGLMQLAGPPLPEAHASLLAVLLFCFVFFVGAIGEEVGWTGYVLAPLQHRWGVLGASIILGLVWAIWHIIPYAQALHPPSWIAWQCISTVLLRIIMVWLYNHSGRSLLAMVLFHAMINVSTFLFPTYGSPYNPLVGAGILMAAVVVVAFFWKPPTTRVQAG